MIASGDDLRFALKMSDPPDIFELRLDCLVDVLDALEKNIAKLRVPLLITARHPREGGAHWLSLKQRRQLLLRFLPRAQYVDVELRSARAFRSLLARARRNNLRRIISFHDLDSTPAPRSLRAKAREAKSFGADIFKVATRTDTPAQLARLVEFLRNNDARHIVALRRRIDLPISAMGIGKLGRKARRELIKHGSVLIYAHLGHARLAGQPSISEIQRWTLDVER